MRKNRHSLSALNNIWFSRKDAFTFLREDIESQVRIQKIVNIFENIHKNSRNHKLLDVACGGGEISEKLIKIGFDVYGLDISPKLLKIAKKKGVKIKKGDISEGLPYKSNIFDFVFAGEIIEHLVDTEFIISELARVIKRSGYIIVTTPNLVHLPDRLNFFLGNNPSQTLPTHEFLKFHIRQFTHYSLQQILLTYGFKVFNSLSTSVVFKRDKYQPNKVLIHSVLLADIFPRLGASIILVARKK